MWTYVIYVGQRWRIRRYPAKLSEMVLSSELRVIPGLLLGVEDLRIIIVEWNAISILDIVDKGAIVTVGKEAIVDVVATNTAAGPSSYGVFIRGRPWRATGIISILALLLHGRKRFK